MQITYQTLQLQAKAHFQIGRQEGGFPRVKRFNELYRVGIDSVPRVL